MSRQVDMTLPKQLAVHCSLLLVCINLLLEVDNIVIIWLIFERHSALARLVLHACSKKHCGHGQSFVISYRHFLVSFVDSEKIQEISLKSRCS